MNEPLVHGLVELNQSIDQAETPLKEMRAIWKRLDMLGTEANEREREAMVDRVQRELNRTIAVWTRAAGKIENPR